MATRQLPGMEDSKLEDLEEAAHQYVKYRDKRQQLTAKEVELKSDLLRLMKKHRKTTYRSDGLEINIVTEEETVKVKIIKPDPDGGGE